MALINIFLILVFLCMSIAECTNPPNTGYLCINDGKKYPQFSPNLNITLSKLIAETTKDSFSISSHGSGTDKVFGLAQCRGDISKKDCSICTKAAATELPKLCSSSTEARIWYDYCFLRYNTKKFFGKVDTYYGFPYSNEKNVTNLDRPGAFDDGLRSVLNEIGYEAINKENKGLGKGKTKLSNSVTLYGLVQCTRDLSAESCKKCLVASYSKVHTYCLNKRGCRLYLSSCYARYELYPFYFPLEPNKTMEVGDIPRLL